MLLAHPSMHLPHAPSLPPEDRDSPAGTLGAASSLAALSYTSAPGGVAGRVHCRRAYAACAAAVAAFTAVVAAAVAAVAAAVVAIAVPRIGRAVASLILPPRWLGRRLAERHKVFEASWVAVDEQDGTLAPVSKPSWLSLRPACRLSGGLWQRQSMLQAAPSGAQRSPAEPSLGQPRPASATQPLGARWPAGRTGSGFGIASRPPRRLASRSTASRVLTGSVLSTCLGSVVRVRVRVRMSVRV